MTKTTENTEKKPAQIDVESLSKTIEGLKNENALLKEKLANFESSQEQKGNGNTEVFKPYKIKLKNCFGGDFVCVDVIQNGMSKEVEINTIGDHQKVEHALNSGFVKKC